MRIGLAVIMLLLNSAPILAREQTPEESSVQLEMEQVMLFFYNHLEALDKNTEAKLTVERLLEREPDNPWLYDLWAAIEWNLVGLELGIKLEERQNILDKPLYHQRADKYYLMVWRGIQLAERALVNSGHDYLEQQQWTFAKATLYFDYGKFAARFENGLRQSDKESTRGIRELKKILAQDPHFDPAFMYLGVIRYQLSLRGIFQRLGIRLFSFTFEELEELCDSVFNKEESIAWIERSRQYGAPQPWLKRNWLEALLVLEGIYNRQRKEFKDEKEQIFIEQKYLPLLELLVNTLPENEKFSQKLEQLKEYAHKKTN